MSPIGGANGSFAQMAAPTMVDPFVQVIENKTWYGGPIYPTKYNKNLPDSENAFSSVNPWFQTMARTLNSVTGGNTARKGAIDVSPEVIEHFFEFAGGGLAKFVNNAATAGSRVIHGEEWLPEKTPFVRRVYGKATTESRRRDFYAAWEEVDAAKFEIDNLVKNVRKGTAGYQQLVSYGQTIGNGLPELIEQNKDAVIQHFAEGNKHMPPQITAAMGPGIIDQVLQLKKQFQAPVI
jgi:hypothetical protein